MGFPWAEGGDEEDLSFWFFLLPLLIPCHIDGAEDFPRVRTVPCSLGSSNVMSDLTWSSVITCLLYSVCQLKQVAFLLFWFYKKSQAKVIPSKLCPLYESKMVTDTHTQKNPFSSSSELKIFKLGSRRAWKSFWLGELELLADSGRTEVGLEQCLSQSPAIPTQIQKARRQQAVPHRRVATTNCLALTLWIFQVRATL